jgi:hypothetical protein
MAGALPSRMRGLRLISVDMLPCLSPCVTFVRVHVVCAMSPQPRPLPGCWGKPEPCGKPRSSCVLVIAGNAVVNAYSCAFVRRLSRNVLAVRRIPHHGRAGSVFGGTSAAAIGGLPFGLGRRKQVVVDAARGGAESVRRAPRQFRSEIGVILRIEPQGRQARRAAEFASRRHETIANVVDRRLDALRRPQSVTDHGPAKKGASRWLRLAAALQMVAACARCASSWRGRRRSRHPACRGSG